MLNLSAFRYPNIVNMRLNGAIRFGSSQELALSVRHNDGFVTFGSSLLYTYFEPELGPPPSFLNRVFASF